MVVMVIYQKSAMWIERDLMTETPLRFPRMLKTESEDIASVLVLTAGVVI